MTGHRRLEGFLLDAYEPAITAKRLRFLKNRELDGIPADALRRAARSLRAASYSALTAARRFEARARSLDHDVLEALAPKEDPTP